MVKRICPTCHQEYDLNVGIHNWKNLFRKPTIEEWITFFIILFVILSYFTYRADIERLKNYYESDDYCYIKASSLNQKKEDNTTPLVVYNTQINTIFPLTSLINKNE